MKFDRKLALNNTFIVIGILILVLVFIFKANPAEWILISIILLIVSVGMNYKWHRIRWLHVVLVIIILFETWSFFQIIIFDYPDLGTVVQE